MADLDLIIRGFAVVFALFALIALMPDFDGE